jgi:hypothetical protein
MRIRSDLREYIKPEVNMLPRTNNSSSAKNLIQNKKGQFKLQDLYTQPVNPATHSSPYITPADLMPHHYEMPTTPKTKNNLTVK